jgi:hypothetical protein
MFGQWFFGEKIRTLDWSILLEFPPLDINEFPSESFQPLGTLILLHVEAQASFFRRHSNRSDVHFNFG